MTAHRYVEENSSAAMLAVKRLSPEVNLWKHATCMPSPNMNKAAHCGFQTQRRHHRSPNQEKQLPHKKDLCPPKIKKNGDSLVSL